MTGKSSFIKMIISSLGAKLAGGECDCPNCRKTEYRSVLLTGDAAKAVTDFETVFKTNTMKIDALRAEIDATSEAMWETVQAATGTKDVEGLQIDADHASAGFIFLRVPVNAPTGGGETGSQPGDSPSTSIVADPDFEEVAQPEQPPIIIPAAA